MESGGYIADIARGVMGLRRLGVVTEEFVSREIVAPRAYPVQPVTGLENGVNNEKDRAVRCERREGAFLKRCARPKVSTCVNAIARENGGHERRERPVVPAHPRRPV